MTLEDVPAPKRRSQIAQKGWRRERRTIDTVSEMKSMLAPAEVDELLGGNLTPAIVRDDPQNPMTVNPALSRRRT